MRKAILIFGFIGVVVLSQSNTTKIKPVNRQTKYYDLTGKQVPTLKGIPNGYYIKKDSTGTHKIIINK